MLALDYRSPCTSSPAIGYSLLQRSSIRGGDIPEHRRADEYRRLPAGERLSRRPSETADLPPIVFIHGASGNLLDQVGAFLQPLQGRAEMLFVDRPGHGYSQRGGPEMPCLRDRQTRSQNWMERRGIKRAIVVGHSFGGAIAAAFGVRHPDKTEGLLFWHRQHIPGQAASNGTITLRRCPYSAGSSPTP